MNTPALQTREGRAASQPQLFKNSYDGADIVIFHQQPKNIYRTTSEVIQRKILIEQHGNKTQHGTEHVQRRVQVCTSHALCDGGQSDH